MNNIKIIIFCDFDGTITKYDTLDCIFDNVIGEKKRLEYDYKVYNNEISNNQLLSELLSDINISLDSALKLIYEKHNYNIIDDFKDYYFDCITNNIKFYVVSAGLKPIIKHFINFINDNNIISHNLEINDLGKWNVIFNEFSKESNIDNIKNIFQDHKTIYIGDGVSDISVIGHTDYLFVKKHTILEKYCIEHNIIHYKFINFNQ